MRTRVPGFALILLLPLLPALAAADSRDSEYGFYETSHQIVQALSGQKKRSGKDLGASRSLFGGDTATRSLIRKKVDVLRVDKASGKYTEGAYVTGAELGSANLRIEFDFGSAEIRASSRNLLNELGEALHNPELAGKAITIAGHTDATGEKSYNMKLSLLRAESVRSYLHQNHGIDEARLEVIGFGEAMPLVDNRTSRNRQLNRRVEIISY